jgi:hypothetical protein
MISLGSISKDDKKEVMEILYILISVLVKVTSKLINSPEQSVFIIINLKMV